MTSTRCPNPCLAALLGGLLLASGCTSTENIVREEPDPLEPYNRLIFRFNDTVDKTVLKPLAQGYQAITPTPVNQGINNFFSNLGDVVVLVNDVLQFKGRQAAMDTSRIIFNTTFGLLGFVDVASRMDLPKHNEDFGQTLGYWGVGEGYYLVLPLLGPSTTRDVWGVPVDRWLLNPVTYVDPTGLRYGLTGLRVVDTRAQLLRVERAFADTQVDPYSFQRQAYLQRRRDLVYDGNPPRVQLDFEEEDSALPPPAKP
jgi:phospholipid-binding lipoprotein MlaA